MDILRSKQVYGSIKTCLIRELIITITNIMEYFLFISLWKIYGNDPNSYKFPQLIGQAKRRNLIRRELAHSLNKVNDLRNRLHPSKQKEELDINCFTKKEAYFALDILNSLEEALNDFFCEEPIEMEEGEIQCEYEGYSQVLFPDFNCPFCHGYHM